MCIELNNYIEIKESGYFLNIHVSFGKQIISLERAEMNHDKVDLPKQQFYEMPIYMHMICINFQDINNNI